jgi:hydroxymethylpyrimidine/phosphomethylpyrimidine kinase
MPLNRPFVLSIAGFDPSGGAGILADIKTFEAHQVMGLGVCTSITIQNEKEFLSLHWISMAEIKSQIEILTKMHHIEYIKIGLIENLISLIEIIEFLKSRIPTATIIWDPILKASAGFDFHKHIDIQVLNQILNQVYLVTPNLPEAQQLFQEKDIESFLLEHKLSTNILLKGGHSLGEHATDILFMPAKKIELISRKFPNIAKHGSGCVLSSAITAQLVLGENLENACKKAKIYIENYLQSTDTLLGIHHFGN